MTLLGTDQIRRTPSTPSLRAGGVRHAFAGPVLGGVDLDLPAGEITCMVGRSGVGKTTLLNVLAGLLTPDGGAVTLDGVPVDRHAVGYLMQASVLLPWLTLLDNVAMPLILDGRPRAAARPAAQGLLDAMDLSAAAGAYPHEVSGGMARRACLARALLRPSRLLLLDEPFTGIDYDLQLALEAVIARTVADRRCAALVVTHSLEGAVALGGRMIVMARGESGSVVSATLTRTRRAGPGHFGPVTVRSDPSFAADYQRVLAAYRNTLGEADRRGNS